MSSTYTPTPHGDYGTGYKVFAKDGEPFDYESGLIGWNPETRKPMYLEESGKAARLEQEDKAIRAMMAKGLEDFEAGL